MTIYKTDFSEYTSDVQPSDWTISWTVTNVTAVVIDEASGNTYGAKVLRLNRTSSANTHVTWDAIDGDANRADVEVLFRFRLEDISDGPYSLSVLTRALATSGQYAWIDDYTVVLKDGNNPQHSAVTIWSDAEWAWCRFRSNGSSHKIKVWVDNKPEPVEWDGEYTSADPSAGGKVGFGLYSYYAAYMDIDYFCAATNGDTAEFPDESGTARVSKIRAEVLYEPPLPETRITQAFLEVLQPTSRAEARVTQTFLEVLIPNPAAQISEGTARGKMFIAT